MPPQAEVSAEDIERVMKSFSQQTVYVLWLRTGGHWRATVALNGFPIEVVPETRPVGFAQVAPVLVNGENTLHLAAEQVKGAEDTVLGVEALQVVVARALARGPQTTLEEPVKFVVEPQSRGYRVENWIKFQAHIPCRWVWQDSPPVDKLSPSDREEILGQIRALYRAFEARDFEAAAEVRAIARKELSKYTGKDPEQADRGFEELARPALERESSSVVMCDEDDLEFHLCGRAVLVRPRDPERPVIEIHLIPPTERSRFPVQFRLIILCKVDGAWRIIN